MRRKDGLPDLSVPHRLGSFEADIVVPEVVPGSIRLRKHCVKVAHTIFGDELDYWLSDIERDNEVGPYCIKTCRTASFRQTIIGMGITASLSVPKQLRELTEHRVDQALRGTSVAMKLLLKQRQRAVGRLQEEDIFRVIDKSQRMLAQRPHVTIAVLG
jgi:hypothetical protein